MYSDSLFVKCVSISGYSREETSQVDMLACMFGDCREGQMSHQLIVGYLTSAKQRAKWINLAKYA